MGETVQKKLSKKDIIKVLFDLDIFQSFNI